MPLIMRSHLLEFCVRISFVALASVAQLSLAVAAPVGVTVRNTVEATVGPNFMGLQYNGPTHRAIDPATGQLADFPSAYATPATQSALNAAGIGVVRVFVDVPQVHPSPGVFDWTDTDTAVAEINATGMTPMLSLNQRDGSWFVGDSQQPWWTQEAGRQEWRVLAEAMAQRYGSQVPYYELLNEPNHIHPTSKSYMGWAESVDLFLNAAEAIHDVDPGLRAGGPASYGSWEPATWAKKVLAEPGGEQQLDFVSYHVYASGNPDDIDEAIFEKAKLFETAPAAIRADLATVTNKAIELTLTEFNTSSVWTKDGAPYTDPRNVDAMGGLVASLGWLYSARGGSDMALRFGTTGGFGLIRWPPEYELQPAYYAARLLHETAGLTTAAELLTTDVTGDPSAAVEAFTIRNAAHEAVILVNTHATESADVAVQFESETLERTLDVFQYNADRLSAALEPLAAVTMIGGIAQVEIAPHTLIVLRMRPIPGDFTGDGLVDAADYTAWRAAFGQTVTPWTSADGNGDGVVDSGDYLLWRKQVATGSGSALARGIAIPEPAGIILVALAAVLLFTGRRRPWLV